MWLWNTSKIKQFHFHEKKNKNLCIFICVDAVFVLFLLLSPTQHMGQQTVYKKEKLRVVHMKIKRFFVLSKKCCCFFTIQSKDMDSSKDKQSRALFCCIVWVRWQKVPYRILLLIQISNYQLRHYFEQKVAESRKENQHQVCVTWRLLIAIFGSTKAACTRKQTSEICWTKLVQEKRKKTRSKD